MNPTCHFDVLKLNHKPSFPENSTICIIPIVTISMSNTKSKPKIKQVVDTPDSLSQSPVHNYSTGTALSQDLNKLITRSSINRSRFQFASNVT